MPSDLASSVRTTVIGAGELKVVWRMREPVTTSSPTLVPEAAAVACEGDAVLFVGGVTADASCAMAAIGRPANTIPLRPPMMVVARRPLFIAYVPSARTNVGAQQKSEWD